MTNPLTQYTVIIAACVTIPTNPRNAFCGQNVEFLNVEPDDTVNKVTTESF
jgi:hypothetical protein